MSKLQLTNSVDVYSNQSSPLSRASTRAPTRRSSLDDEESMLDSTPILSHYELDLALNDIKVKKLKLDDMQQKEFSK